MYKVQGCDAPGPKEDMMTINDGNYIWVDSAFAEKWKKLESDNATLEQQAIVFDEYIESVNSKVRKEFRCSLESLEEDSAMFAGLMLQVKQAFGKAKDKHIEESYALWEKFEDEQPSTIKKIDGIVDLLTPLEQKLTTITDLFKTINTYSIDQMNESVTQLADSLKGRNKEMFAFLIENFKMKE